jgi:tetratricopeptide (TPR) repeat protein
MSDAHRFRPLWFTAAASILCALLITSATAQMPGGATPPPPTDISNITEAYHQGGVIRVTVLNNNRLKLQLQSAVRLHCDAPAGTIWQTTSNSSETTFLGLSMGKYDIQVSAVGYQTAHKGVTIAGLTDELQVQVVLERDPMAVNLDDTGSADTLMPPKASKETRRAVAALSAGNLKEALKHLNAAYKLVPSNAQVNFLLGYMFFQQKNLEQAQTYLAQAAILNPRHVQALTLLGRLRLLRGDEQQARIALEQAVTADARNWMAQNLLGDVYLKQHEYEKAREHAQLVVDNGGEVGNSARLVLAQALANLGRVQESITALKAFLQVEPTSPAATYAQGLLAELNQRASDAATVAATTPAVASPAKEADPFLEASEPSPLTAAWLPPGVDETKPAVASGVSCPYEDVIQNSGEHVKQLVDNVARFAAIEDLLHEQLDPLGNPSTREKRTFDYAASITEARPGVLLVDEYRTQRHDLGDLPDQIATSGFTSLALVFHPSIRDNFQMTCEGLGGWHGQATWLVHFRQREDRPSRIQGFQVGDHHYPVALKGRAWITADKFQIVRIESELVKPMPYVKFLAQHQIVEYGAVHFEKGDLDLWLPKSAEVYLDLQHRRYYRRHSFDHYMLFSVDSEQKIREAKHDPRGPGSISPKKRRRWPA